jgi:hypothetical protein
MLLRRTPAPAGSRIGQSRSVAVAVEARDHPDRAVGDGERAPRPGDLGEVAGHLGGVGDEVVQRVRLGLGRDVSVLLGTVTRAA